MVKFLTMNKIVVIGSSNTDMVIKAPRIPHPGETIIGGRFLMNPGGKGANQAVAAARMGARVCFISRVGNDIFGRQALENFESEGIDISYVSVDTENPSGVALIMVDANGENCIAVAPGANNSVGAQDIALAGQSIHEAAIVLVQLEIPLATVELIAETVNQAGGRLILNPAPAATLSDDLLKKVYLLTPNESEAELLTGIKVADETSAEQAAAILRAKGVENIVITLGSAGAYVSAGGFEGIVPGYKVQALDTTAAGDTFNGALAVAISEGKPLPEAVSFANKVASISVTRMGAQSSVPYRKEVMNNE